MAISAAQILVIITKVQIIIIIVYYAEAAQYTAAIKHIKKTIYSDGSQKITGHFTYQIKKNRKCAA